VDSVGCPYKQPLILKPPGVKMITMQQQNIRWNYSCGLPRKFYIQKMVFGYADLSVTKDEYEYAYKLWTKEEKQMADDLVCEIEAATVKEMIR